MLSGNGAELSLAGVGGSVCTALLSSASPSEEPREERPCPVLGESDVEQGSEEPGDQHLQDEAPRARIEYAIAGAGVRAMKRTMVAVDLIMGGQNDARPLGLRTRSTLAGRSARLKAARLDPAQRDDAGLRG